MLRSVRLFAISFVACTLLSITSGALHAGTIIKLSLGSDLPPDIEFDGTTLSTIDDGNAGTTGDQNTNVTFLDFLTFNPDILPSSASYSLNGLTADGPAFVFGGVLVLQNFMGGTFELYDPGNVLLLSGSLDGSTLSGLLGPPATGALFTTSFSTVTGGLLAPYIDADTLSLSMNFTDINGGAGLSISPPGRTFIALNPFTADAALSKAADRSLIPEPTTAVLLLLGIALRSRLQRSSLAS